MNYKIYETIIQKNFPSSFFWLSSVGSNRLHTLKKV